MADRHDFTRSSLRVPYGTGYRVIKSQQEYDAYLKEQEGTGDAKAAKATDAAAAKKSTKKAD